MMQTNSLTRPGGGARSAICIGAMHIARPQRAPLDIAELVEHEQWMITGAGKVAIVGTAFLLAVSRAFTRIHVEHDGLRRSSPAHLVNPLTGQIGESNKVLGPAQPFRFETPHLAGRGAYPVIAFSPATQRIAGSRHSHSASFTSS